MSYPVFHVSFCRFCNRDTKQYDDLAGEGAGRIVITFCRVCRKVVWRGAAK